MLGQAQAFGFWQLSHVKIASIRSRTEPQARGVHVVGDAVPTQLAGNGTATGAQFTPIDPVVAQVELGFANRPKPFTIGARHAVLVQAATGVTPVLFTTALRSCGA